MESMTFAQPPRAVAGGRTKYRSNSRMSHSGATGNLMYDRRVMRGNTYGGIVVPGGPSAGGGQGGGASSRRKRERKYIPPTTDSIFNIRPEVERREGIDLTEFLISKEDAAGDRRVEAHVESQTDALNDLPPPAPFVPRKTGVDATTQIEPEDNLFKFDLEVEPILEVLVGKTLEQSLLEVQEEEELSHLRARKEALYTEKAQEEARIRGMEQEEQAKWEEKERYRLAEAARVEREGVLEKKVWASYMSKTYVKDDFVEKVFDSLEGDGVFRDPVRRGVEEQFMPWVLQTVGGNLDRVAQSRRLVDSALERALGVRDAAGREAARREQRLENAARVSENRQKDAEVSVVRAFLRVFLDVFGCVGQSHACSSFPVPVSIHKHRPAVPLFGLWSTDWMASGRSDPSQSLPRTRSNRWRPRCRPGLRRT